MLEQYHHSDLIMSFKVRFCVAEKGLGWQEHRTILGRFENLTPQYLKINPDGVVPILIQDGEVILEYTIINEYLDEVFPSPSLKPATPLERAGMEF